MVWSFKFQLVTRNSLTMFMDLQEVTAVEFDGDADYLMAVGSSAGMDSKHFILCVLISA